MNDDEIEKLLKPNENSVIFKQVCEKLAEKSEDARECRRLIEQTEQALTELKDQLKKIEEEDMPALLDEIGVSSITLSDGTTIYIDTSLHAAIPAAYKSEAFVWLRDNDHGDLIKNEIIIKFNRNEGNYVGAIKEKVEEFGLHYDQKESVHSSTLKAFVKEQMKAGVNLPNPEFDIFIKRTVSTK